MQFQLVIKKESSANDYGQVANELNDTFYCSEVWWISKVPENSMSSKIDCSSSPEKLFTLNRLISKDRVKDWSVTSGFYLGMQ